MSVEQQEAGRWHCNVHDRWQASADRACTECSEVLHRVASRLFDATAVRSFDPVWRMVRDAHKIANIRATFIAAVITGRDADFKYLAEYYWPSNSQVSALESLQRIAASARRGCKPAISPQALAQAMKGQADGQ